MLLSSFSGELLETDEDSFGDSSDLSDLGDTDGDFTLLLECMLGLDGLDPLFDKFGSTASNAEPIEELLVRPGGTKGSEYGANLCTPDAKAAAFRWWFCCCWWLFKAW